MEIRLLGPVQLWAAGRRVAVGPPQRCAVLAVLAAEASRPVPVETLIDWVWGEALPARVRSAIHVHMTLLRRVLAEANAAQDGQPPVELVHQSDGYVLRIDPQRVDLHRFRHLASTARHSVNSERTELLRQALALWRGPAMAALQGDWAARMRQSWGLERLDAAVDWARAELRQGHLEQVISQVRVLLGDYPLAEPLAAVLMRALAATGRSAEALDCFTAMRQRLVDQLGIDPGAELQELQQAILRGELDHTRPVSIAVAAPTAVGPAQLPLEPRGFAGRVDELGALDAIVDIAAAEPTAVVISAIAGTAGVGKTALAVHWAHHHRHQFPDGQLYVNLRGFDPGGAIMAPATAVRLFLDALHVPPQRIPVELDAQVNLYRTLLADKRMLVVLDNARDADQVRALLPGAPGSLVLITSRNQLTSLVAAEGAHHLTLDLLTTNEAHDLLTHRLGIDRVTAEPDSIAAIITACARLPLALSIVAARAAITKDIPLAILADELDASRDRLDALSTGDDPHTDVQAVFSWSYRTLTTDAARVFRLLGLHPGPDISAPATASLGALALPETQALLAELTRANLLVEDAPGRYAFHDLLRTYATDLAYRIDTDQHRHTATHRVLDHYLHTSYTAARLLDPARDPLTLTLPAPGITLQHPADYQQALDWFTVERAVLLAAVRHAAATGFDAHTWQLAWTLVTFLDRRGHWHDWTATGHAAMAAAHRLADPVAQIRTHRGLARAYNRLGRLNDAHIHLDHALDLTIQTGDRSGQAHTHHSLSYLWERRRNYPQALHHARQSLTLHQATGNQAGQAYALNVVGWCHALLGNYQQALTACQQALTLHQELEDRDGQAAAWDSLGYAHHHLGHHTHALTCYRRALSLVRDLGDRYYEATALTRLGDTHHATGNSQAARDTWQQALTILDDLDHPDADQVRAKLANPGNSVLGRC